MENFKLILENQILPFVERPAQYIGGEYNSICKSWSDISVKMAFLFPDTYEIGMSHLGLRVLYEAVNREENLLLERAFAPLKDMEGLLREMDIPLFSWESRHFIRDFDVVGFTLQYELSYTNVLNMLDLSALPVRAKERLEAWPLVIAGGPTAYNPEPLADFIDVFLIGEGEESLVELLRLVEQVKSSGGTKAQLLKEAASLKGFYVPSLYEPEYDTLGALISLTPQKGAPELVEKRIIRDFDAVIFPAAGILPSLRVVHDRIMLEIMRGCCRGCRFCQAGIIYRPVREKRVETLLSQARQLVDSTGYDELGLISLSSADYTEINSLANSLLKEHSPNCVGVSLPSLRVDAFSVELAQRMQQVRKSGLTLAPEAGSQRMRDSINKGISEEQILEAAKSAFQEGWSSLKLYFMLGLPGETDEDILAIGKLCQKIIRLHRENRPAGKSKPLRISLGVASLVPKPHTPFQWYGQVQAMELRRRQALLRESVRPLKAVNLSTHNVNESLLEAAFARGGRNLGRVLEAAWRKGCTFDGWREHFRFDLWLAAFAETGLSLEEEAARQYGMEDVLPWDHISCGVDKNWLWQEKLLGEQALTTQDCRNGECSGCGVCQSLGCANDLQGPWISQTMVMD